MRDTYKLNQDIIKGQQTSFNGEKTSFIQGAYKTFSCGYLRNCKDSTIATMYNKINEKYSKIENGYLSIANWLETYIQDAIRLENSLKSGTSLVNDYNTSSYLDDFVGKNTNEVNNSPDVKTTMKNFSASLETTNAEMNDEIFIDEFEDFDIQEEITVEEYQKLLETLKSEAEEKYNEYKNRKKELLAYEELTEEQKKELDDVNTSLADYKSRLDLLNQSLDDIDRNRQIEEYESLLSGEDFKNFIDNYDLEAIIKAYDERIITNDIYIQNDLLAETEYYIEVLGINYEDAEEHIQRAWKIVIDGDNQISTFDFYNYSTEEQRQLYHYLWETKGYWEANKYASLLMPDMFYKIAEEKEAKKAEALSEYTNLKYTDEYKQFVLEFNLKEICDYWEKSETDVDMLAVKEWDDLHDVYTEVYQLVADMDPKYVYENTTADERMMFHFLYKTQGREAADKYIKAINEDINCRAGTKAAMEFIESLDLNDEDEIASSVSNLLSTTVQGISDGIGSFSRGIREAFRNNRIITEDEYKTALIIQYLSENKLLKYSYMIGNGVGNFVPVLAASAAISVGGAAFLGATVSGGDFAAFLLAMSAYGNSKHQALVNGASDLEANIYGIFSGATEGLLERFMGGIISASEEANILLKMLKEGGQEFLQEFIDAGLRTTILGDVCDISDATPEAFESFLIGALTAGLITGSTKAVEVIWHGQYLQIGIEYLFNKLKEGESAVAAFDYFSYESLVTFADDILRNQGKDEAWINNRKLMMVTEEAYVNWVKMAFPKSWPQETNTPVVFVSKKDLNDRLLQVQANNYKLTDSDKVKLKELGIPESIYKHYQGTKHIINKDFIGDVYLFRDGDTTFHIQKNYNTKTAKHTVNEAMSAFINLKKKYPTLYRNYKDIYLYSDISLREAKYKEKLGYMGDKYKNVHNTANSSKTYITIFGPWKKENKGTLIHEAAHSYDSTNGILSVTGSNEWRKVVDMDGNYTSDYSSRYKTAGEIDNFYAEDWADFCKALYTDPNAATKNYPNRVEYLKKYHPALYKELTQPR